jgi:hypothetical protein
MTSRTEDEMSKQTEEASRRVFETARQVVAKEVELQQAIAEHVEALNQLTKLASKKGMQ